MLITPKQHLSSWRVLQSPFSELCRALQGFSQKAFPKKFFPKLPGAEEQGEAGLGQALTCPGGRRRSLRCASGNPRSRKSPQESPPLVSAWEEAGGEPKQAWTLSGGTRTPRATPGTGLEPKRSEPSWSHHQLCQGAALTPCCCLGGRRADWGL